MKVFDVFFKVYCWQRGIGLADVLVVVSGDRLLVYSRGMVADACEDRFVLFIVDGAFVLRENCSAIVIA